MSFPSSVPARRPLDRRAYLIVALAWLLALTLLVLRGWALGRIDPGFLVVTSDRQDQLWALTQSRLVLASATGELLETARLEDIGIDALPLDATPLATGAGILTDQGLLACRPAPLRCEKLALSVTVSQGKVAYSVERNELALVDNQKGVLHLFDASALRLKASSNANSTPMNHPNKPTFTRDMLVVANTGSHALLGWPLAEGETPPLGEAARVLFKTLGQPYYPIAEDDQRWLILEGGSVLNHGVLRRYQQGQFLETVPGGLGDATGLAATAAQAVALSGYDDKSVRHVSAIGNREFFAASALDVIREHFAAQNSLTLASRWAAIGAAIFLVAPIGLLLLMGYDIQQSLGSAPRDANRTGAKDGPPANEVHLDHAVLQKLDVRYRSVVGVLTAMLLLVVAVTAHDFRVFLLALPLLPLLIGDYVLRRQRRKHLPQKLTFLAEGLVMDHAQARPLPYSDMVALIRTTGSQAPLLRLVHSGGQLNFNILHSRGNPLLACPAALDTHHLAHLLRQHLPSENCTTSPLGLYRRGWQLGNKTLRREASFLVLLLLLCVGGQLFIFLR